MLRLGLDLSLTRARGAGGGAAAVSDQTAQFGALTLAGDGGFKPVDENGSAVSLVSVDDQTGTTRTWSISGGRLVADGTPDVDDGQTITVGYSGGTAVLTLRSIANAYSAASDADVDAFFAQTDATIAGNVLLAQNGYSAKALQFMDLVPVFGPYHKEDVDGFNTSAWSLYFDIYHHKGAKRVIYAQRQPSEFAVRMNNGVIEVSNFSVWTTGSTAYNTGRLRAVVTWDGTTLKAWVRPVGGSTTQEINAAVGFSSSGTDWTCWGGFPANLGPIEPASAPLRGLLYDGALWSVELSSASRDDLLTGGSPASHSTGLFWNPSVEQGNIGSGVIPARRFVAQSADLYTELDTTSGAMPGNFVVMRDPDSGAPIQHNSKYWAAADEQDATNSITLATSPDLTTWTYDSTLFNDTQAEAVSDFLYLGNVAGSHDPFFLFVSDDTQIDLYTSADMVTFTADGSNPVADWTPAGATGVEDFRIVWANSAWYAVYEADNLQDGTPAIGLAKNTNTVPSGDWTNVADQLFPDADEPFNSIDKFIANPTIIKKDGVLYCFYEGANFDYSLGGNNATLLRTVAEASVEDGSAWKKHGIVHYHENGIFPNAAIIESEKIWVYANRQKASQDIEVVRFDYMPHRLFLSPDVKAP